MGLQFYFTQGLTHKFACSTPLGGLGHEFMHKTALKAALRTAPRLIYASALKRKESTMATSTTDTRDLFRQAIRLANSKYRSVLILEGTGKELTETGVRREAMQGALITISLLLGVSVLRSKDPYETANLIIYASMQIKSTVRGVFQRRGYQPKGKRKQQLFILQGLPGIGSERAIRLLNAFGSVEAVITATREELQSVEGIGENIAGRIKWAVREEIQSYGVIDEFPI